MKYACEYDSVCVCVRPFYPLPAPVEQSLHLAGGGGLDSTRRLEGDLRACNYNKLR